MKTWIITGYSSKMDGLLYCVKAETEKAAIQKVGIINETRYVEVEAEGVKNHVLCTEDISMEDLVNGLEQGECRWFWQMFAQELKMDSCMTEATCW